MDSSNAEKAWEKYSTGQTVKYKYNDGHLVAHPTFMAGRASRDAEVELLRERLSWTEEQDAGVRDDLTDLDAEVGVLREQLAAAEAVIEKAKAAVPISAVTTYDILCAAPSSALAAVKADAWDEGARYVTADSTYTEMFDIPANPYRSGTEAETGDNR